MLLRLFLFAICLVCSLAPARALEPLYVVHMSLHPATRELHVRMRVTIPTSAERRFGLGREFALQTLTIDGQTMDPAAQTWPVPTGRPVEIVYRAALPSLEAARASPALTPFADPEGSFLPLVDRHAGLVPGAFTYDVTIDVPAEQRAVAPGRLVEERETEGRYIARFVFDKPAWELSVFAGPYVVGETMHGACGCAHIFPKTSTTCLAITTGTKLRAISTHSPPQSAPTRMASSTWWQAHCRSGSASQR